MSANETTRADICLRCPRGCSVKSVLSGEGEILSISGNRCKLGIEYVTQEITDPRRVLPTLVRVTGGTRPLVPVWTPEPIPKGRLLEVAALSRAIEVQAPVHVGDEIYREGATGVRLVASGEVPRKEE